MIAPCKDCTEREVGCHGTCDKYIAYKDDREETLNIRRSHLAKEQEFIRHAIERKKIREKRHARH